MTSTSNNERAHSWVPVIFSSVVYPGIGQFMQRRSTAGFVYAVSFGLVAVLMVLVLVTYFRELIPILQRALEGSPPEADAPPDWKDLLKPLGLVLFIYVANVVDVLRGRQKSTTS